MTNSGVFGRGESRGAVDPERIRLSEANSAGIPWRLWGPYLSERQWGTVREDYSANGDAWNYLSHERARSYAYKWGEDGIAGISDERQLLCFALALWNGRDPILKERMFGLTNAEGNHGEDVKEYYFYVDNTPTHSYMRYLYKYPQAEFPYYDLVATNRSRTRWEFEYELMDTGVFEGDRYFDVTVEYAKANPTDLLVQITAVNNGPEPAPLHVLPTLWFRNTWSGQPDGERPTLAQLEPSAEGSMLVANHSALGTYHLACDGEVPLLFTDNETNKERLFGNPNTSRYVKDGIHECVIRGDAVAVSPEHTGTKAAAHYSLEVPAGASRTVRLRLRDARLDGGQAPAGPLFGAAFDEALQLRRSEADEFYAGLTAPGMNADEALVLRQALSGMLWTKQFYLYDVNRWLGEHGIDPWTPDVSIRNRDWYHMLNGDILSMPDKWEYPWYAAWDLAFHVLALAQVDIAFAKSQMDLMLHDLYLHPNGQIPAYEWNFGDVNPPVHAWATYLLYSMEQEATGHGDVEFLKRVFSKLMMNFTWWVNRKDPTGRNVFQGGFLGLDNIGVFDRSAPLPTGGTLEQADGTAWMALYCQNMLQIAIELAMHDPVYEELALKFIEHLLWIAAAIGHLGTTAEGMWDEEDGFFYDVLRLPDGSSIRLKVRSVVGLLPIAATTVLPKQVRDRFPHLVGRVRAFLEQHPQVRANVAHVDEPGVDGRTLLALCDEEKLRRVLARMLDENEFLSPHGIRSLSRFHLEHPYIFNVHGQEYRVDYEPSESTTGMFGGNSNWRGPVWAPMNTIIIRGLVNLYAYYGDDFTVECPTGSGIQKNLFEVAKELSDRFTSTFLRDENGHRPVFGGQQLFVNDPRWRDNVLFYEYFHGDNGAGLGASHQTGWTGIVAMGMQLFHRVPSGQQALELARVLRAREYGEAR